MKIFTLLSLSSALCLATSATGWARDRDKDRRCDDDRRDHHHHHGHRDYYYRSSPVVSFGYRPYSYGYYPSYYSGYPYYSSSYYSRPSIALSFSTRPSYSRSYRSSDYGDELAVDVQRALARRGYYRGAIDGDVGSGTRAAIRRYQYDRRLEVTGRIDRSLLNALGLS